MTASSPSKASLTLREVFSTWWPLAASWMLMGLELPALSAIVARLPQPEINLAAYGGVVFPLALIIESPIIMLLAASTALSKDLRSYRKVWHFMMWASAALTAVHALVAFTPLYYFVVERLIGAPPEIVEPARMGLKIMLPWTWAIAYRRFNQGVLIRFGHSPVVSAGTFVRLSTDVLVLLVGFRMGTLPGVVVATAAVATGVVAEALYVGIRVRPVIREELRPSPLVQPPLSWGVFFDFYIPLAMTSLLTLVVQPIGSAALSRMPQPLESLAVWPVISGFIFLLRGMGIAFNEVVVSLLERENAYESLRAFTLILSSAMAGIVLVMSVTPLAEIWFLKVSALSPELASMAKTGLWIALLMPPLSALQSWYQGTILHSRKTRGITESVVVFILTISAILWAGVAWSKVTGLYLGLGAFVVGMVIQTFWLWRRSRPAFQALRQRDQTYGKTGA